MGQARRRRARARGGQADLVALQGDRSALVSEVKLETGGYSFLQLQVVETTGVLTDGSEVAVAVPGEAPLKFGSSFETRAGGRTTFTADFTPCVRARPGATCSSRSRTR